MTGVVPSEVRAASSALHPEQWPAVGRISGDRAATMGMGHHAFPFQGAAHLYDAYAPQRSAAAALRLAEVTAEHHARYAATGVQFLNVFVPSKVSMLGNLYPFLLRTPVTPQWVELKRHLRNDSGVLFLDDGSAEISGRRWEPAALWQRVGSHWSTFGCLAAVNAIMVRLGLAVISPPIVECDMVASGDLSTRWRTPPLRERILLSVPRDAATLGLPEPVVMSESGTAGGTALPAVARRVTWKNRSAPYPARICLVDASGGTSADRPDHLAWWLSRVFGHVTLLRTREVPGDLREVERPDVVVVRGDEHALAFPPGDAVPGPDRDHSGPLARNGHG